MNSKFNLLNSVRRNNLNRQSTAKHLILFISKKKSNSPSIESFRLSNTEDNDFETILIASSKNLPPGYNL
jgi:hypothetical protein